MPRVYSYIRFSSKAQATGDSLRRQTADTEKWATRHGHELDEGLTYRDLGVSAYDRTNLRSGSLGLFLRAAQEGKIERGSILAIEALDRLTRAEPLDAFRLLSDIVSCGITIVTVSDERVYSEESLNGDFASLMLAAALLVRGHEESKRKSERLKSVYSARRESKSKRIGNSAPHWLCREGDGWGIRPVHAQTVLEIFQLAAEGLGSNAIARRFNAENRPTINENRPALVGGWHPSTISALLRKRVVLGEHQPYVIGKDGKREAAGDPIPDHYPAVVPEELFWRVQALMTERNKRGIGHRRDDGYGNILGGFAFCGYCGVRMFLDKKGRKRSHLSPVAQYYYGCSASARGASNCNNRVNYLALLLGAVPRPWGKYPRPLRLGLLPALFEHLLMAGEQLSDSAEQQQAAARNSHAALSAQLAHTEGRKATLIDSLENGLLTPAEVRPRLDRIRSEAAQLETQLDAAFQAMRCTDARDDEWLVDAVESHMAELIPVIKDDSRSDERAALRTRLLQRVDAIYLYRDCARVKLRHRDVPFFIPLEETADVANAAITYPLPEKKFREK